MKRVNLAEAKAKLSELVTDATKGEIVEITRRGKPVARIVATQAPRRPINIERIRAITATMPLQKEGAGDFVGRMRDEDRY